MHIQFQKFMMQIILYFWFLNFHLSENKDIFVQKKKKNSKKDFMVASQGVVQGDFKCFN